MDQMSAQAKIFTDRLFAQINPRFSPHFKKQNAGKKLVFVFAQGNPDPGMFQVCLDCTKHIDVKGLYVTSTRIEAANERKDLNVYVSKGLRS